MRSTDRPDPDLTRPIIKPPPAPAKPAPAHICTWAPAATRGYERCTGCGAVRRAFAAFALAASLAASLEAHGAEVCLSSVCRASTHYCQPLLIERADCPACPACATPAPPRRVVPKQSARQAVKPPVARSEPPVVRKGECPK